MKKYILQYLLCIAVVYNSHAQHSSVYSQYILNGLVINPAYAGSNEALSLSLLYRNQWLGLDGAPQTITFSGHTPLNAGKNNLGLSFINDRFGISDHNTINLSYAYRFQFWRGYLALGLQGGVDFLKLNWSSIKTTQESDPSFSGDQRFILPVAGCGLYYHSRRFFLGISAPSLLNKTNLDQYFTSMLYSGIVLKAGESIKLKPAVLVKYIKGSPFGVDITLTTYLKEIIGLGLGYRINDAVFAFLDLKINDQFRLGYCYDYSISELRRYTAGSHEIMLRYLFLYKTNSQSARYF